MKHLKMLGLAAVAAAALMALVGAGTATAETSELFSGATTLSSGTTIKSSLKAGTSALLSDTSGELADTCKGSTVEGKTTNTTGSPVTGNISTLDWNECNWTTTTLVNGSLSITKIAGGSNGTVSGSGSKVTVQVFGFLDCIYGTGAGTHLGTLDGVTSGNATMTINATVKLQEGAFCPETTKWVATYLVTSPTGLNVGS